MEDVPPTDGIADALSAPTGSSLDVAFGPVRSHTAFEETVDRLGNAIKLGLLPPGTRLPAERRRRRPRSCGPSGKTSATKHTKGTQHVLAGLLPDV